ncbi:MAG: aminopeptidase N [Burkholderiaceae bacterium]|nr:aminopeptidase N [Burkholderiaceae bacterium]
MTSSTSHIVFRKDYLPPDHNIKKIHLTFDLVPNNTVVTSVMEVEPLIDRNSDDLQLDGEDLELLSIKINGEQASREQYDMVPGKLIIHHVSESTVIEIQNRINPKTNLEFSGLYMSKDNFITQCEAEGFRRITYFPDRPDILAQFTTRIHAPHDMTVLLSNGNLLEEGNLPDGRRYAVWEDPFPKPSYLFALVAGNFLVNEEKLTLMDGREVLLQIWVEPGNENKTAHAMESLKKAILWDEKRFGLSLDLDRFMIVATDDFNMGAMENKGLNIFNSKYVLANPQVATDTDYANIEAVIGHEYFHNWTGNRVTCRDWFQLSLKEGLTVFREQEFVSDSLGNKSAQVVKRLQDVQLLRTLQFPEDAGPMSHPVRPDSYTEINNFYTMTVYEKGAEIVRMYQTLFGKEGFARGLQEYLRRYDGSAATCDDFRCAMAEANDMDLSQFDLWYSQCGTPHLSVHTDWNETDKTLTLTCHQTNRVIPGQKKPQPLLIPITMGLLNPQGKEMLLSVVGEPENQPKKETTLIMTKETQSWTFSDIKERPVLSIGRGFSAPVIFETEHSRDELIFLASNDSDLFNRAEAFQKLTVMTVLQVMNEIQTKGSSNPLIPESYLYVFVNILNDQTLSPAYKAFTLSLPSEQLIGEECCLIEPEVIRSALDHLRRIIGKRLKSHFDYILKLYQTTSVYKPTAEEAGKRAFRHLALSYLVAAQDAKGLQEARNLFTKGNNTTDRIEALKVAVTSGLPFGREMLEQSAMEWHLEPLLMNKWLQIQALSRSQNNTIATVDLIRSLMVHPAFSIRNPNNVYSLLGTFFKSGGSEFHTPDGKGYQLWLEAVLEIDSFNPQVASRLARSLENWKRYKPSLASMMYKALRYVSNQKQLSQDVREVVDKALFEPV